jgi:hypothetical protein
VSENIEEKLSFRLMKTILGLISESGANQEEALAALKAAEAMVPEQNLSKKSTTVIQT